jgi:hypothetical protein
MPIARQGEAEDTTMSIDVKIEHFAVVADVVTFAAQVVRRFSTISKHQLVLLPIFYLIMSGVLLANNFCDFKYLSVYSEHMGTLCFRNVYNFELRRQMQMRRALLMPT